jgi:hypothetical protein
LKTNNPERINASAKAITQRSASGAKKQKLRPGVRDETELYKPIKKWIDGKEKKKYAFKGEYISKVTGPSKGQKRKTGTWSRPDVSVVTVANHEYLPHRTVEITTVEAKRYRDIKLLGLFEAVSHTKFGHKTYLALEWRQVEDIDDCNDEDIREVLKEALRFGVGVIQMRRKTNKIDWDIRIVQTALHHDPDARDCNRFLGNILTKKEKVKLKTAIGK